MNVFLVPSWYPHRCHPLHGVFFLDQATAIAELRPQWKVAISRWRQGEGRLSLAHLRRSPRCLVEAFLPAPDREPRPNLVELTTPAPSWSERLLGGNREGILAANRRNLERARRRFGGIDLLHAHVSYPGGWAAMRLSAETGIPYAITEHMGPFPLPVYRAAGDRLVPWIREPLERAHARIAVSAALARRIAGFGIEEPEVVPNVVDERLYAPAPRAAGGRFVFLTLAQMEPVKGIDVLLEAWRLLLESLPEAERGGVELQLGGDGPARAALERQARALGVEPVWLGFLDRERAARAYRECDCFVLPSRHESFGVVLVEALASGKPLIATRSGGPEAIVTPEAGILVPVEAPGELAQAMRRMLHEAPRYDPGALRSLALRDYSRAAVVGKLERIYSRIRTPP